MKINPITREVFARRVNNTSQINGDTDINVKKMPTHKEKLETFINAYGEKELKRFGLIECETCKKRIYKKQSNGDQGGSFEKIHQIMVGEKNKSPVSICPECNRRYDDQGLIKMIVTNHDYQASLQFLEGLIVDEKL